MADPKKPTTSIAKTNGDDLTIENFQVKKPAGGILVTTNEAIYAAEKAVTGSGEIAPVIGWLVGVEQIKSPKYKEKMCLVVELTEPTICATDGKPFVMKRGRVLIPISTLLEGWEEKATHETLVSHCCFQPLVKEKQANGHDLWKWEVTVDDVKSRSDLASESLEGMRAELQAKGESKQIAQSAS